MGHKFFGFLALGVVAVVSASQSVQAMKNGRQTLLVDRQVSGATLKAAIVKPTTRKQSPESLEMSDKGVELVKQYEGYHATPYVCPGGKLTIGYGHVILKGEKYSNLNKAQATALLKKDLAKYERDVNSLINVKLTQEQYDALVSFTYNLGPGALQKSGLRKKVNGGQHKAVPAEFLKWSRCKKKILPGLVKRRKAEAQLYQSI